MSFSEDIGIFIKKTNIKYEATTAGAAEEVFNEIIDNTPLWFDHESHTGNTKHNWQARLGSPSNNILSGKDNDKEGKATKARALKKIKAWAKSKQNKLYFTNNVPWILVLEDGLYPEPEKGSYNTKTKKYEKRSSGGYSKQAPQGMVKKAVANFKQIVERKAREVKDK